MRTKHCRFSSDTEAEHTLVRDLCMGAGAFACVVANHWALGGAGAVDLGNAVLAACESARSDPSGFKYTNMPFVTY